MGEQSGAMGEIVEESVRGVHFEDPVWLDQQNGAEEEAAAALAHKRAEFEPGDDVVQACGEMQTHGSRGKPPTIYGCVPENIEGLPASYDELREENLVGQLAGTNWLGQWNSLPRSLSGSASL